jgi:hypothetical protein
VTQAPFLPLHPSVISHRFDDEADTELLSLICASTSLVHDTPQLMTFDCIAMVIEHWLGRSDIDNHCQTDCFYFMRVGG